MNQQTHSEEKGSFVGWFKQKKVQIWLFLVVFIPASIINVLLSWFRNLGLFYPLGSELLWIIGIDTSLQFRVGFLDGYFLITQGLILLFSLFLVGYKETKIIHELKKEALKFNWLFRLLVLVLVGLIFVFLTPSPNFPLTTEFIYAIPPGHSFSILSLIFASLIPPFLLPVWQLNLIQGLRLISLLIMNCVILGGLVVPIFRYEMLRLVRKDPKKRWLISFSQLKDIIIAYFSFGTILRVTLVGFYATFLFLILIYPPTLPSTIHHLADIISLTIQMYTFQGSTSVTPINILAITVCIWLVSVAYYAATSELKARIVFLYTWVIRIDEILLVGLAMLVSIVVAPFLAGSWVASAAASVAASVSLHRVTIRAFIYFDNNAENFVGFMIQGQLTSEKKSVLTVGGGWVGREVLTDLIPFELISTEMPTSIKIWSGGPSLTRYQRGAHHFSYIMNNLIVLDKSEKAVRLLGEHSKLGPYGTLEFPVTSLFDERVKIDVSIPALLSEAGNWRTPLLSRANVVVMTADDPGAAHILLEEIARQSRTTGHLPSALMVRGTGAAQIYELARRGEELGVPVIHVYFEREIGYHLGIAMMIGPGTKLKDTASGQKSRSVSQKTRRKTGFTFDYLLVCEGQKRVYYILEALFMHGQLEASGYMVDKIPIMRACIVSTSDSLLQRCVKHDVNGEAMILYPVSSPWMEERTFYVPVIAQIRNYPLLHRLILRNPVRGVLIAQGQVHETFTVVGAVSAALQQKIGQGGQPAFVVVAASGESDLAGARDFLRTAGLPHYALNWVNFVACQINSILRVLRTEPGTLDLKKHRKALSPLIQWPSQHLLLRLYCPVAALMEKMDVTSPQIPQSPVPTEVKGGLSCGPTLQQIPPELREKRTPGLIQQNLSNSAKALYLCIPDKSDLIFKIPQIITDTYRTSTQKSHNTPNFKNPEDRPSEPYDQRNYSLVNLCFDNFPSSFNEVLQRTFNTKKKEKTHKSTSQDRNHPQTMTDAAVNLSFMSTFDCGINHRTCVSLFIHRVPLDKNTNQKSQRHPLKFLLALAPEAQHHFWRSLLQQNLPTFQQGELKISEELSIFVAKRPELNGLERCIEGSCSIRNFCEEINKALQLKGTQSKIDSTPKKQPKELQEINFHFLQLVTCSTPIKEEPTARLIAFANLLSQSK